jgi:hypothetical protein
LKGSTAKPAKKPRITKPPIDRLTAFIEAVIGEADNGIRLIDRDLMTNEVNALFDDGSRFTITVAQSD